MMDECRVVINCPPTLFLFSELRREGRKYLPHFLDRVFTATESKKELERARDSQVTLIFG